MKKLFTRRLFVICIILITSFVTSGCMPTIFVGTTSVASRFATSRTTATTINDAKIIAQIKLRLFTDHFKNAFKNIKVEVFGGRVLYTGTIEKESDAIDAVQVAWEQPDVIEVINETVVDENYNYFNMAQYTRDTLITTQIKAKMLIKRNVKSVNFTIVTISNIVYLFGIARSEEELETVATIAANVSYVEKVISHVHLDEERYNKINDNKSRNDKRSNQVPSNQNSINNSNSINRSSTNFYRSNDSYNEDVSDDYVSANIFDDK